MINHVIVYTRSGCQLCEVAIAHLKQAGLNPQMVDIDTDPQLTARFDTCVPVVMIDGEVRFRGRINPVLLQRLLNRSQAGDEVP